MIASKKLLAAVQSLATERFGGVKVDRVEVEDGFDHDGESVLFVRVIPDATPRDVRADALSEFTRYLRTTLGQIGEQRYPHTSFISKTDSEMAA